MFYNPVFTLKTNFFLTTEKILQYKKNFFVKGFVTIYTLTYQGLIFFKKNPTISLFQQHKAIILRPGNGCYEYHMNHQESLESFDDAQRPALEVL